MKKPADAKDLGDWENNWNILRVQTVKIAIYYTSPKQRE